MRAAVAYILLLLLVGCASQPALPTEVFDACPHYPLTVIPVSSSLILHHVARQPCAYDSTVRPLIGSNDSDRTYSTYELLDANGKKLFTAPSMLSDPKYEKSFQFDDYYRKNDQITVLTSQSKNTILIMEDRSPAYPRTAFIFLRRQADGSWTWSQMRVPTSPQPDTDMTGYYPQVVGLSDTRIWFNDRGVPTYSPGWSTRKGRTWSRSLDTTRQDLDIPESGDDR